MIAYICFKTNNVVYSNGVLRPIINYYDEYGEVINSLDLQERLTLSRSIEVQNNEEINHYLHSEIGFNLVKVFH